MSTPKTRHVEAERAPEPAPAPPPPAKPTTALYVALMGVSFSKNGHYGYAVAGDMIELDEATAAGLLEAGAIEVAK